MLRRARIGEHQAGCPGLAVLGSAPATPNSSCTLAVRLAGPAQHCTSRATAKPRTPMCDASKAASRSVLCMLCPCWHVRPLLMLRPLCILPRSLPGYGLVDGKCKAGGVSAEKGQGFCTPEAQLGRETCTRPSAPWRRLHGAHPALLHARSAHPLVWPRRRQLHGLRSCQPQEVRAMPVWERPEGQPTHLQAMRSPLLALRGRQVHLLWAWRLRCRAM